MRGSYWPGILAGVLHIVVLPALPAQHPSASAPRIHDVNEVGRIPVLVRAPGLSLPTGFDLGAVRDTVVITFVVDTTGHVDPATIVVVRAGDAIVRAALVAHVPQTEWAPGAVGRVRVPVRMTRQLPMPLLVIPRTSIASVQARVRALVGAGPFTVPPLQYRYQRREYCEGDYCGCAYGRWEANATIPVFPAELDTLHPAFQLDPGEPFDAMPGYHHVVRPSVVIVLDSVSVYRGNGLGPGDTLYLRRYTGELFYEAWRRDSVISVETFWAPEIMRAPKGALVQAGTQEWWVPIRSATGRSGWIRPRDPAQIRGLNRSCIPTADPTIW